MLVTSNPNIKRVFDLVQICAVPGLSMCDDMATAARLLSEMGG